MKKIEIIRLNTLLGSLKIVGENISQTTRALTIKTKIELSAEVEKLKKAREVIIEQIKDEKNQQHLFDELIAPILEEDIEVDINKIDNNQLEEIIKDSLLTVNEVELLYKHLLK